MTECGIPEREVVLSILIPTIGRPELKRILGELHPQLSEKDEIIIIGDGPQPNACETAKGFDARIKYLEHGPDHCWGHPQRNWAMPKAVGTHIMSFDDDDRCAPTALRDIRKAVLETSVRPLMFREYHEGAIIWNRRAVECGNVSTQLFVTPNVSGRLGIWGRRYVGDFDFICSTLELYPDKEQALVWREEVIAVHGTISCKEAVDHWEWNSGGSCT
jgi:glycosyltransferase involved in cell wall biosynthesis